jgi:hypothetical protein
MPAEFAYGPVIGNQTDLTAALLCGDTDVRHLHGEAESGRVAIVRGRKHRCEMFFRNEAEFVRVREAMERRQRRQAGSESNGEESRA